MVKKGRFQCRNVAFTVHRSKNPDWKPEDIDNQECKYIVGQWEECPKTKAIHFQGYAQLKKKCTSIKKMKKILASKSVHVEAARGTAEENDEYCTKSRTAIAGTLYRHGEIELTTKGKRNDLDAIQKQLDKGVKPDTIAVEHFGAWCRNYRAIDRYAQIVLKKSIPDFRKITVQCLWGEAGVGKSREAIERSNTKYGPNEWYEPVINKDGQMWFSNYEGQKCLIINEFYGQVKFSQMLKILDGYKLEIEKKGGSCWAAWETIIITSNKHPKEWWNGMSSIPQKCIPAFVRRFESVEEIIAEIGQKRTFTWEDISTKVTISSCRAKRRKVTPEPEPIIEPLCVESCDVENTSRYNINDWETEWERFDIDEAKAEAKREQEFKRNLSLDDLVNDFGEE